jgi:hypothetical protein
MNGSIIKGIKGIKRENYIQVFDVSKQDRQTYGEIYTPFSLIEQMFSLFNNDVYADKNNDVYADKNSKWLDTGAGSGFFSIYLYWKLMEGLAKAFENEDERHDHIIKNMIYMVEIKESNVTRLLNVFGKEANIICADYTKDFIGIYALLAFDYIIGNPPYNSGGIKKVPSNATMKKTDDGKTVWKSFVKKSLSLLKKNTGKLLYIIPSIWMKPTGNNKCVMYNLLTGYQLEKLHCLSNTETNKYFKGEAQTPTCFFLLTNKPTKDYCVDLYDYSNAEYVKYVTSNKPIPVFGASVVKKLLLFGNMSELVKKTNCPGKDSLFSPIQSDDYPFKNIKTCILEKSVGGALTTPTLVIEYSNKPQAFYGKPKLVLAHKMYGFPFIDAKGEYGISSRDNYVICTDDYNSLRALQIYLSTKLALYLFESTRYRMKYLEKYAFEFLPNILNMKELVSKILLKYTQTADSGETATVINGMDGINEMDGINGMDGINEMNELTMNYFNLNDREKESIRKLHKKRYESFST